MKIFAPDYYHRFKCIAGQCRHSCCIGWEIDIDSDTCAFYKSVEGELGRRLSRDITEVDGVPCFRLAEDERCPFLNRDNLCDIILELGEDALCDICAYHPRFRNFFDGRTEIGLGLCCEAAARLILGSRDTVSLAEIEPGEEEISDEVTDFLELRDGVFALLQDRGLSIGERINRIMREYDITLPNMNPAQWIDFFLSLERLNDKWGEVLSRAKNSPIPESKVDDITTVQLLVYFVYRHLADGLYDGKIRERLAFSLVSAGIVCNVADYCGDVFEAARMYSAEIEYSQENIDALLDLLSQEKHEISFRLAGENDIPLCMNFIEQARAHQLEQGFLQWTENSPNVQDVIEDIERANGYLALENGVPFGYVCISFLGEAAYDALDGEWLSNQPYAMIHRLAFAQNGRGKGLAKEVFAFAGSLCNARNVHSLRIDTHADNAKMRHIIEREGFTYCGTVMYVNGSRMAYELLL